MPAAKRGRYFYILSGAALAAASEGIFVIIHSCFKDKYFPCGEATQGIKEQGLRIYCGFDVLCLLLSEVIPLRVFVDNRRRFLLRYPIAAIKKLSERYKMKNGRQI